MITESPVLTSEKSTTFVTIVGLHRIEKFLPSVNRTLKERYPSSCQCEIQSTFLPCTSGYRRRSFFFFLDMRVLRHCALDTRSGWHRTIWFATGVDPFGFFRRFLQALAPGEKLNQRRLPF